MFLKNGINKKGKNFVFDKNVLPNMKMIIVWLQNNEMIIFIVHGNLVLKKGSFEVRKYFNNQILCHFNSLRLSTTVTSHFIFFLTS